MVRPAVLIIDIGTSVIKSSLFDFTCRSIDRVRCPHESDELDLAAAAERWWAVVAGSVAILSSRNPECRIAAVGITGFMHSVIALDRDGEPLPLPGDGLVRKSFDEMLGHFGAEEIHGITGSRLDVTSVPPQVLAWRENSPAEFSRIATILPVKDFIRYRLTGELATDQIDACGTMLYDVRLRRWDSRLCSYCGLKPENVPPVLHCTEVAAVVRPEAAGTLGLPEGIPVAVGGGDDIEILGSGACGPEQICEHVGSTGSFLLPLKSLLTDPACRLELYPAIARGEWVLGGSCSNTTRALDWYLSSSAYSCAGAINWDRVRADLPRVLKRVTSDRPLFFPYLYGERAPVWDPDLGGGWFGLRGWHTADDLLVSVIEGICFSLRSILDVYGELGLPVESVHSSGGLNQLAVAKLRASVYGKVIRLVRGADPTSFATAAITLCAIGELGRPSDATEWLDFEPDVEPETEWQTVLCDRYSLFVEHTRSLSAKTRIQVFESS